MALRSEYSLGHSQFNDFLFAYVGEEKEGREVTVLSALARLGLDPWEEAARLSTLSEEAATSALTATIARVPEGNWRASDARAIALRLVDFLPRQGSSSQGSPPDQTRTQPTAKPPVWTLLARVALAAALVAIVLQQPRSATPTHSPATANQS